MMLRRETWILLYGHIACFHPSGVNGVLSTSNTAYQPAYGTTTG
jgi:hypothetical protein